MNNIGTVIKNAGKALVLSALISSMALLGVIFNTDKDMGTVASIKQNVIDVEEDLKKEYSEYSNVSIYRNCVTLLDSKNYDQAYIRDYYNSKHPSRKTESGICWAAAHTGVVKYYGVKDSYKDVGNSIMEIAYNNKLWDGKNGFDFSNSATLLTKSFAKYNVNKKGNIDRYDIYDELVSEVNAGRVCIFKLKEHETVGCGHTTFVIKYTKKNLLGKKVNKQDEKEYVVLNDTWSNTHQYSYFPEDEIETGLTTRKNFGITKVRNK